MGADKNRLLRRRAAAFVLGLAVFLSCAPCRAFELLTAEEAAMPDAAIDSCTIRKTDEGITVREGRARKDAPVNNGPSIVVVSPEASSVKSPLFIDIRFVPQPGSEVDLRSFRLECLKFLTIDITDKIRPYVTKKGIRASDAKLPTGNHKLRLTVSDTAGGTTQETFVVKVVE